MRDPGSIPRGILMWNRDSPVSVVSLHWWPRRDWSLWPRLRRASSQTATRLSCRQCDNPTWPHTALLSQFHTGCRSSFQLHNRYSQLLGGALWRACNLTAFTPCLTGPVDYPFAPRHEGPGFNPQGNIYVKPGFSCCSVVLLQSQYLSVQEFGPLPGQANQVCWRITHNNTENEYILYSILYIHQWSPGAWLVERK